MGRPSEIKKPRQQLFCRVMAATGDATYAAARAGYKHHQSAGANLMTRPEVQQDVLRKTLARIRNEVFPLATDRVMAILENPKSTDKAILDVFKATLRFAMAEPDNAADKEQHQMTLDELRADLKRSEHRLAHLLAEDAELIDDDPAAVDQAESSVFD